MEQHKTTPASVFDGADWDADHPIKPTADLVGFLASFDRVAGELPEAEARRLRALIEIGIAAVNLQKAEAAYGFKRELIMESARDQLGDLHNKLRNFRS